MDLYQENQKKLKNQLQRQFYTCNIFMNLIQENIEKIGLNLNNSKFSQKERQSIIRCSKQLEEELQKLRKINKKIN